MISGWFIKENTFTKGFTDYVVRIQRLIGSYEVAVTVWKGSGQEDTQHTKLFEDFEHAFAFVDEFSSHKIFEKIITEYFGG